MGSVKTARGLVMKPAKYIAIAVIAGAFAFALQSCGADTGGDSLSKYEDVEGPAVSFRCPQSGATLVGSAPAISFDVSDSGYGLDETAITSAIFVLKDSSDTTMDGQFAYSGGTVTFSGIALVDGVYTARVTGLLDKGSNTAASSSWDFTVDASGAASSDSTGTPACPAKGGGGGGDSGGYGPVL